MLKLCPQRQDFQSPCAPRSWGLYVPHGPVLELQSAENAPKPALTVQVPTVPAPGEDYQEKTTCKAKQGKPLTILCAMQFEDDWRTFRALLIGYELRLSAADSKLLKDWMQKNSQLNHWAHQLTAPELGCLLVARHADAHSDSEQSVVLLCHHGESQLIAIVQHAKSMALFVHAGLSGSSGQAPAHLHSA